MLYFLLPGVLMAAGLSAYMAGVRARRAARAVPRVQVPARLIRYPPAVHVQKIEVEYPGPDGRPLRGILRAVRVQKPGRVMLQPEFQGSVWVDPKNPADVALTAQGQTLRGDQLRLGGAIVGGIGLLFTVLGIVLISTQS